jgi:hypothetical protein
MRIKEGQWVKILVRRFDSPDMEFIGKATEVNEDYIVAETMQARRPGTEPMKWAMDCTADQPAVWITPMARQDWAARNRRKHAGFRL